VGLVEVIRLAAENGCEIEPAGEGRVMIRAIAYDADPYELEERRLLKMSREEFLKEWLPPRYE
jgi:hypothetical protein